jgi:hypothetical protein
LDIGETLKQLDIHVQQQQEDDENIARLEERISDLEI